MRKQLNLSLLSGSTVVLACATVLLAVLIQFVGGSVLLRGVLIVLGLGMAGGAGALLAVMLSNRDRR